MFSHVNKLKKMQNTRAQSELCVVFFVYACFTNVYTGETNEISRSRSTKESKMFLFFVLVFVLISRMFTIEFSCTIALISQV